MHLHGTKRIRVPPPIPPHPTHILFNLVHLCSSHVVGGQLDDADWRASRQQVGAGGSGEEASVRMDVKGADSVRVLVGDEEAGTFLHEVDFAWNQTFRADPSGAFVLWRPVLVERHAAHVAIGPNDADGAVRGVVRDSQRGGRRDVVRGSLEQAGREDVNSTNQGTSRSPGVVGCKETEGRGELGENEQNVLGRVESRMARPGPRQKFAGHARIPDESLSTVVLDDPDDVAAEIGNEHGGLVPQRQNHVSVRGVLARQDGSRTRLVEPHDLTRLGDKSSVGIAPNADERASRRLARVIRDEHVTSCRNDVATARIDAVYAGPDRLKSRNSHGVKPATIRQVPSFIDDVQDVARQRQVRRVGYERGRDEGLDDVISHQAQAFPLALHEAKVL